MVDEVARTALEFDARPAEAGAARFHAAGEKVITDADGVSRALVRTVEPMSRVQRQVDTLARRLDPFGQAVRDAQRNFDTLTRIAASGGDQGARAADLLSAAARKVAEANRAQQDSMSALRDAHTRTGAAVAQTGNVMRQFGVQSIDVFQQLASGAPVMTTFIQQGGQMAQIVGSSGGAMTLLRAAVAAVVSPIGLATAGVVAFGVAAGVALSKASTLSDETKALSVSIAAVGRNAELSAGQIQTYITALARQGVARDDANAIVGQLSRTTLTQPQIQQVTALTPDTAVALGVEPKQAAKDLAEAMGGSYDAIKRLDDALNILTASQREAIRTMLEHGDKAGAVGLAMDRLAGRVDGLRQQSLSPMKQAFEELGNGWDAFVTRVAKSAPVVAVMESFRKATLGWADILKGETADVSTQIVSLNREILTLQSEIEKVGEPRTAARKELLDRQTARLAELRAQQDELIARARSMTSPEAAPGQLPGLPPSIVAGGQSTTELDRQSKAILDQTKALRDQEEVLRAAPALRDAVRARQQAMAEAMKLGLDATNAATYAQRAYDAALRQASDGAAQNAAAIQRATEASVAQATAADNGRAAMLRAAAAAEAHEAAATQAGVAEAELAQAILDRNAAQEAARGAGVVVDLRDQIAALDALAKATSQSGTWYAELDNEIRTATKSLQAHADVTTDPAVKEALTEQIALVKELTARQKEARGAADMNRATVDADTTAEAQRRILAAYDGTTQSLVRARNEQTAYGLALQRMRPDQDGFADAVNRYAEALNRSSEAAQALEHAQSSVNALFDTLGNAADRLGQSFVDAFMTGQGAAVNFWNVVKAAGTSVMTDLLKQAAINPFRNMLSGSTSAPSLWTAFGTLSGSGGSTGSTGTGAGGGLMDNASNLLSLGSLGDKLGLTDIGGWLSGIGESVGLTGSNGLLSGLGSLSSILSTGINGVGLSGATTTALAALPGGMAGPATASSVAGAMGGASIGQALGGVGGGFALGSLAGGFVQNSLGKVGPAPMIGAGAGALAGAGIGTMIFPGVGTVVGGLLGGLLGGGGGGLIGPQAPSSFSSTGVSLQNGQLALGQTVSQIADTAQEVANATQQLAQINQYLSQSGITIATLGQLSQIGQNTPGETPDPTKFSDIASGFNQLRFTSDDPTKAAALADKAFGSLQELATALDTVTTSTAQTKALLEETVPALLQAADGTGAFAQQLAGVSQPYDAAIAQAKAAAEQAGQTAERITQLGQAQTDLSEARTKVLTKTIDDAMAALVPADGGELAARIAEIGKTYGTAIDSIKVAAEKAGDAGAVTDRLAKAESDLIAARDKATAAANDAATEATRATERALLVRTLSAQADISGNPYQVQSVKGMALGEQQRLEARAFDQQLTATYGEAFRDTADYAERMTALERAQQAERLSSQEEFARRMVAIERGLVAQIYSLQGRQATADAAVSGDPTRIKAAAFQNFDEQARVQRQAQEQSLVDTYGEGVRQTQMFADVMRQVDDTLYAERLALQKQYANQALQVERDWIAQVNSIQGRRLTAEAAVSGDPGRVQSASLSAFDEQARITRLSYEQQMVTNNGEGVRNTAFFADVMRQVNAALDAERTALMKQYADQSVAGDRARADMINGLFVREATAKAATTGAPADATNAGLRSFDEQARLERQSVDQQLVSTLGEAVRRTQYYADVMRQVDVTLYAERTALQKQYAEQSVAQDKARLDMLNALSVRGDTARAAVSGDPAQVRAASLRAFDEQARLERQSVDAQLASTLGEGIRQTTYYAAFMREVDQTLYAERLALQKQFADQSLAQDRARVDQMNSLTVRQTTAEAAVSGDPARIQAAALGAFDEQARLERQAADQNMVETFGEGVRQTQRYTALMTQLDRTLYAERLALQKQYADQSLQSQQAAAQTAGGIVVSLTEYVRSLQTGANSSLTAQAKYDLASRQFDVTRNAAAGGDLRALQNLTSYADTLVSASRGMFGSGIGYVQDINRIVEAIGDIALQPPDMLTNAVLIGEMRGQTQELVDELRGLRDELVQIKRGLAQSSGAPPANRAA